MAAVSDWRAAAERSAGRLLDSIGRATARLEHRDLDLQTYHDWNDELDLAVRSLPTLRGVRHDVYLELVRSTDSPKRHLLVTDADGVVAVISVRGRGRAWEPVTYQCLPGVIAPHRSVSELGRVLHRAGLDIHVEAGLEAEMAELGATMFYPYDVRQIDLGGDYEAYWRSKGLHKNTKRAVKRCAEMDVRVDAEGGIARTVEQWRAAWADDPRDEVGAAMDRERFWTALAAEAADGADAVDERLRVVGIELVDGERTVAGTVSLVDDDRMLLQCFSRDPEYDWHMAGTRVIHATVEWAVDHGCALVDFGGGEGYKRWWAPTNTVRYGAIFRPRVTQAAYLAGRVGRTAAAKILDAKESLADARRARHDDAPADD